MGKAEVVPMSCPRVMWMAISGRRFHCEEESLMIMAAADSLASSSGRKIEIGVCFALYAPSVYKVGL